MNKTLKTDQAIISLLKLVRVDRIICDTDKGLLKLCLRKGESNYYFTLDATELPKDLNKELFEILFPKPLEIYYKPGTTSAPKLSKSTAEFMQEAMDAKEPIVPFNIKKPLGRPKKTK